MKEIMETILVGLLVFSFVSIFTLAVLLVWSENVIALKMFMTNIIAFLLLLILVLGNEEYTHGVWAIRHHGIYKIHNFWTFCKFSKFHTVLWPCISVL